MKLCLNCMKEMPEGESRCPHCGNEKEIKNRPLFLPAGSVVKGYTVGKQIAYCGDCAAYVGRNELTGEKIIIREFLPTTLIDEPRNGTAVSVPADNVTIYKALLMDFIDLYNSLFSLNGEECLVTIMEMFQTGGTAYVIQEYSEGMSLEDLLSERGDEPLLWDQTETLIMPLLKSLDRIHKNRILHRAICPKKIIISRKGEVKLVDFSVSSARTEKTEISAEIFGGYSAPEQYRVSGKQGAWTDVYGICATLYRMVTGVTPQDAATRLVSDKLVDACIMNETVPASVSDTLKAGMALMPATRIATMEELIKGLSGMGLRTRTVPEAGGPATPKTPEKKPGFFTKERIRDLKIAGISAAITVVVLSIIILTINGLMSHGDQLPGVSDTTSVSGDVGTLKAPAFVGKTIASVQANEAYKGFDFELVEKNDDNVVAGVIMDQTPKEGESITSSQKFTLTISKGPKTVNMPSVLGLTVDAAKAALDKFEIRYEVKTAYSATDAPGTVIGCNFNVNDQIKLGTDMVELKVANDQSGNQ